jgi:hypothetical protein
LGGGNIKSKKNHEGKTLTIETTCIAKLYIRYIYMCLGELGCKDVKWSGEIRGSHCDEYGSRDRMRLRAG